MDISQGSINTTDQIVSTNPTSINANEKRVRLNSGEDSEPRKKLMFSKSTTGKKPARIYPMFAQPKTGDQRTSAQPTNHRPPACPPTFGSPNSYITIHKKVPKSPIEDKENDGLAAGTLSILPPPTSSINRSDKLIRGHVAKKSNKKVFRSRPEAETPAYVEIKMEPGEEPLKSLSRSLSTMTSSESDDEDEGVAKKSNFEIVLKPKQIALKPEKGGPSSKKKAKSKGRSGIKGEKGIKLEHGGSSTSRRKLDISDWASVNLTSDIGKGLPILVDVLMEYHKGRSTIRKSGGIEMYMEKVMERLTGSFGGKGVPLSHINKKIGIPVILIPLGYTFLFKDELKAVGMHHQIYQGISHLGQEFIPEGADFITSFDTEGCIMSTLAPKTTLGLSITMNGGYVDDIDQGDMILYTGVGSDPKHDIGTDEWYDSCKDQSMSGTMSANAALFHSGVFNAPIRVIRGSKTESPYSPLYGLRYDGLYQIVHVWQDWSATAPRRLWRYDLLKLEDGSNYFPPQSPVYKYLLNSDFVKPEAGTGTMFPGSTEGSLAKITDKSFASELVEIATSMSNLSFKAGKSRRRSVIANDQENTLDFVEDPDEVDVDDDIACNALRELLPDLFKQKLAQADEGVTIVDQPVFKDKRCPNGIEVPPVNSTYTTKGQHGRINELTKHHAKQMLLYYNISKRRPAVTHRWVRCLVIRDKSEFTWDDWMGSEAQFGVPPHVELCDGETDNWTKRPAKIKDIQLFLKNFVHNSEDKYFIGVEKNLPAITYNGESDVNDPLDAGKLTSHLVIWSRGDYGLREPEWTTIALGYNDKEYYKNIGNQFIFPYLISLNYFGGCGPLIHTDLLERKGRMGIADLKGKRTIGPIYNTGLLLVRNQESKPVDEFQDKELFKQIVPKDQVPLIDYAYSNRTLCFGSLPIPDQRDQEAMTSYECVLDNPKLRDIMMCDDRYCRHCCEKKVQDERSLSDKIRFKVKIELRDDRRAVFADEQIPAYSIIGPLSGEIVTEEESTVRVSMVGEDDDIQPIMVAGDLLGGYVVDMTRISNALRLLRNSCVPNVYLKFRYSKLSPNPKDPFYKVPVLCTGSVGVDVGEELLLDHFIGIEVSETAARESTGVGIYSPELARGVLGCVHYKMAENEDIARKCGRRRLWKCKVPKDARCLGSLDLTFDDDEEEHGEV